MSEEVQAENAPTVAPVVVDGISPNGVNAFVSKRLGIALVVKPVLTSEDFDKFVDGVVFSDNTPIVINRSRLLANAIGANILVHMTDKCTREGVKKLEASKVQWYGEQLTAIYYQYAYVDPN